MPVVAARSVLPKARAGQHNRIAAVAQNRVMILVIVALGFAERGPHS
jgi:hypothetical protein